MRLTLPFALACLAVAGSTAAAQERYVPSYGPFGRGYRHSPPISLPCPPGYSGTILIPGGPAVPSVPLMDPPTPPPGFPEIVPPVPVMPGERPAPDPVDRLRDNAFAQAREAGGQPARSFNENFDGDFNGVFYRRYVVTGVGSVRRVVVVPRTVVTQQVTGFTPTTTTTTNTVTVPGQPPTSGLPGTPTQITTTITNTTTNTPVVVNVPVTVNDTTVVNDPVAIRRLVALSLAARYSGVLITDNDNPRPQDRVYGGYTFYDGVAGAQNPGLSQVDQYRQLVGFERTFLDGDASFGMRLPFVQQYGGGLPGTNTVGDLSLLLKYAFVNNRETGDVVSAGFVLTTPTGGGSAILLDGSRAPHSVLFQPWVGFVKVFDRAYVQGISSFVFPSDGRDPTLFNNSLGVGYYLYRNSGGFLTGIVPVGEVHVRTPLSNRNPAGLVFLQDQVNLNAGLHFRFNRATFSTSLCVPVVGPRPWNVEAMAYFNYAF